jgi:hypothetical protein
MRPVCCYENGCRKSRGVSPAPHLIWQLLHITGECRRYYWATQQCLVLESFESGSVNGIKLVYDPSIPWFAVHFEYFSRSLGSADGLDCSSTSKKSSRNTGSSPSLSFGTSRQFISTAPLHFDSHGENLCSASYNGISLRFAAEDRSTYLGEMRCLHDPRDGAAHGVLHHGLDVASREPVRALGELPVVVGGEITQGVSNF